MHGPNLFASEVQGLREIVIEYMAVMTDLGHKLMEGISLSLGLPASYFQEHYTADPTVLFRIFNYPSTGEDKPMGSGRAY
jgi:polar amino acid transport system ATP-binding protein